MGKDTIFIGQPLLSQMASFLDKREVMCMSRSYGGERYIKRFDGWQHLMVMLYAVIMRFDSLREITASLLAEANKLAHVGIMNMPRRSTLSDANARRPEAFFGAVYERLYERYKSFLSSDSRRAGSKRHWEDRLFVIDSTTITLFSNLLLTVMKAQLKRKWGFSNLATMVRILLMCYINFYAFFEQPENRWEIILSNRSPEPPEQNLVG